MSHDARSRIALIGDPDPGAVIAHRAIPVALERAAEEARLALWWEWIPTADLGADVQDQLAAFAAVWCVPASPYANTSGALAAIRFARESGRPFLGTCGGFQHALLDYAEHVWGVRGAAHAETDPEADDPVIAPLACGLVETSGRVRPVSGSKLAEIYGSPEVVEGYHCRFGLSPRYAARLDSGPLRVAARDESGEIRAIALDGHPFFVATLFQPERAALDGRNHPLVAAFAAAAAVAVAHAPEIHSLHESSKIGRKDVPGGRGEGLR